MDAERGRGAMARTALVALLAVAAVAWLVRGDVTPSALPGEDAVTPTPSPDAEPEADPVVDDAPDGVERKGRWWPSERTDTILAFAGSEHVVLVDLDLREMRTYAVPELTGGDPPHRLAARGEALVFWGGGDVHVLRPGPIEQLLPPARTLAASTTFVPSAEADRVWVMAESDAGRRLLEVTVDGEVATEVPAPHPHIPQLALTEHLLFADGTGELWPLPGGRPGALDLAGGRVLAGQGSALAWCDDPTCRVLHVGDAGTGAASWTEGRWQGSLASFDPTGELLALAPPSTPGVLHITGHDRVELAEPADVVGLVWSTGGDTLFAVTAEGDLVVHRVGGGGTEVLELGLPPVADVVALSASRTRQQRIPQVIQALDGDLQLWHAPGEVALYDAAARRYRWSVEIEVKETPGVAALSDGVLYLPASRDGEGDPNPPRVRAIDLETGEVRWDAELLPGLDLQWSAPVVTADLVLVSDTQSHLGSAATSWVHALDRATGEVVWRFDLNDAEQGFHSSPLLAADGVVALASKRAVVGLDLASGEERWRREGRSLPQLVDVVDGVLRVRHDGLARSLRMADGVEVDA